MKKLRLLGCIGILIWASSAYAAVWTTCGNTMHRGPSAPPTCRDGEGVNQFNVFTGNAHRAIRDLEVWGGVGEHQLVWQRLSNTRFTGSSQYLGTAGNWRHSYQWEMANTSTPGTTNEVTIFYPDGTVNRFQKYSGDGTLWLSTPGVPECLLVNTNLNLYVLQRQDGWQYTFTNDVNNASYQLQYFMDSQGNRYDLTYTNGRLWRVTEPAGRYLQITYTNISVGTSDVELLFTLPSASCLDNAWYSNNGFHWAHGTNGCTPYRYYRYVGPDGSYSTVGEIILSRSYSIATARVSGTPFGVGATYANASDGDTNTYYSYSSPNGGYAGVDLGPTNACVLLSAAIFPRPGIGYGHLMAGGRLEAFNIAPTTLTCISSVSTMDGRSVTYTYSTLSDPVVSDDPSGSLQYQLLTRADYGDGTHAEYTYQQVIASTRPLLVHTIDPRYTGSAVNIGYVYNSTNTTVLGFIKQEINGASSRGDAVATLAALSATNATVTYANTAVHQLAARVGQTGYIQDVSAKTDALGRATRYTYNTAYLELGVTAGWGGFVKSMTDAAGHYTEWNKSVYDNPLSCNRKSSLSADVFLREEWTRDDLDLVLTHTVYNSYNRIYGSGSGPRTTTYTRDALHRVTGIQYPDGTTEAFTYNGYGQVSTHTLRNGLTESFAYDSRGLKITATDAMQHVTAYTYDSADRVACIIDALGHATQYTYNERGLVTGITYADGNAKAFSYDSFGNLTTEVNSMGQYSTYVHDEFRRRTQVTDPLGRVTRYGFGGGPGGCASCGAASKPTSITLPSGKVIINTYDAEWQKISETVGGMTTTYGYDLVGNLSSITDPNGKQWVKNYDYVSRLTSITDPLSRTTQWTYDGYGNKLSDTRPDGKVTSFAYDTMNRMTTITDPSTHTTTMTYDASGNQLSVTDAKNQSHVNTYDGLGRLLTTTYPDSSQESYVYDAVGNVIQRTSRSGKITTYSYDEMSREIQSVTQN